ncbi:DNA-binding HxlR family transcriptional regulator [Spirosoma lacussanchae]|uniref:winged helix-turn-helix transcriptional regulator n=1 Tax=Spirosoma lacussanchae TaxID=1884249 RepID=UPI001108EFE8|nr:helix-turn-helix domain-containing protein [Spirosoma lacussanchae]
MLNGTTCPASLLSIKDALEVLEGKWKLLILFVLSSGPKRFSQLSREMNGISDRTLSKELKLLEINQLITRTVTNTPLPEVHYEITPHGRSLAAVLDELHKWGLLHRSEIIRD